MNPWVEITNDWLLRTTVEGSVLILTVLGLIWTFGRHLGPRWRVALWMLVGLKLLVPAFLALSPGIGNWFRAAEAAAPVVETKPATVPVAMKPLAIEVIAEPAAASVMTAAPSLLTVSEVLLLVWLAGAVAFLAAVIWRQHRFVRRSGFVPCRNPRLLALVREVIREVGVKSDFRVLSGPAGATPAVFGFWAGNLVVPRDWESRFEPGVLRYILMHEIEHIRHRDLLLNWVATLVNALHWFNPLVWIAVSRFQSDRELRCDANTLERLQPSERFDYGRTLLHVQNSFLPAPAIAGVAPCVRNHPTLQQRIQMITNPTQRKRWLNAILVPGLAGLIALSFGSATAEEERPSREGGPREGEQPREGGPRDGEKPREGGPREGGPREGEQPREGGPREGGHPGPHPGEIALFVVPDGIRMGDRFIPNGKIRGELVQMRAHSAVLWAEPEVAFRQINQVTDALRDVGVREIRLGGRGPAPGAPGGEGFRPPFGPRPEGGPRDGDMRRPEGGPRDGDMRRPEGGPRDGDMRRPEGGPRDGDMRRPEGAPRDGDMRRPEGAPRDGDMRRPEGAPRDGERPRPEGGPRDGERPRPEGAPRDGERPRPEGALRDGEGGPRLDGGPRDGDRPRPEEKREA
jgi:beta-lactamase regulating signal transducer with metallopeptidase domain